MRLDAKLVSIPRQQKVAFLFFNSLLFLIFCARGGGGGGGGGGARKSVRTPSSNIVEFSKLKSDFKEKRYDGLKKGA